MKEWQKIENVLAMYVKVKNELKILEKTRKEYRDIIEKHLMNNIISEDMIDVNGVNYLISRNQKFRFSFDRKQTEAFIEQHGGNIEDLSKETEYYTITVKKEK